MKWAEKGMEAEVGAVLKPLPCFWKLSLTSAELPNTVVILNSGVVGTSVKFHYMVVQGVEQHSPTAHDVVKLPNHFNTLEIGNWILLTWHLKPRDDTEVSRVSPSLCRAEYIPKCLSYSAHFQNISNAMLDTRSAGARILLKEHCTSESCKQEPLIQKLVQCMCICATSTVEGHI